MPSNKFNLYNERCPSRNVLEGISDKWSILAISILSQRTCRFGELRREIGGISQKMLSQTLKILEKYGFIQRKAYSVLPMKVEYSLSPLGKELSIIVNTITAWTEKNMEQIIQAEQEFMDKSK